MHLAFRSFVHIYCQMHHLWVPLRAQFGRMFSRPSTVYIHKSPQICNILVSAVCEPFSHGCGMLLFEDSHKATKASAGVCVLYVFYCQNHHNQFIWKHLTPRTWIPNGFTQISRTKTGAISHGVSIIRAWFESHEMDKITCNESLVRALSFHEWNCCDCQFGYLRIASHFPSKSWNSIIRSSIMRERSDNVELQVARLLYSLWRMPCVNSLSVYNDNHYSLHRYPLDVKQENIPMIKCFNITCQRKKALLISSHGNLVAVGSSWGRKARAE